MTFEEIGLGCPNIPLQETSTKKVLKMESESGYTRSRARSIRSFKTFNLKYSNLQDAVLQNLIQFHSDIAGNAFTWTHPVNSQAYMVMFEDESLSYSYGELMKVEISFALREVW